MFCDHHNLVPDIGNTIDGSPDCVKDQFNEPINKPRMTWRLLNELFINGHSKRKKGGSEFKV